MKWKRIRLFFLLAILAFVLLFREGIIIPNQPSTSVFPVRGIDVSHHNGQIDWSAVAGNGIHFAFIKATEGSDLQDPQFSRNGKEAAANGIVVGAYHFFSTLSPGAAQAANFIQHVPRVPGMLPPAIDVEFAREHSAMSDLEFEVNFRDLCQRLEAHYGVPPVIYTTGEFHADYFAGKSMDRLWIRAVFLKPDEPAGNWMFWQYSSKGRIPGIAGKVDLNVFRGSAAELALLKAGGGQGGGGSGTAP